MSKISVIIPTRDRPEMLLNAIYSVLGQSHNDFEILIINSGGPILKHSDKRIRYFQCKDGNPAKCRNVGLKNATGDYIAYLDDDDIYYPDHLQVLSNILDKSQLGEAVVYSDAYRSHQKLIDGEYKVINRDSPYGFKFDYDRILVENFIPTLCIMHKRECIDKIGYFNEEYRKLEDWDYWIRLSKEYKFTHIKKHTCEFSWRVDGSSTTSKEPWEFWQTVPKIYKEHWTDKLSIYRMRENILLTLKNNILNIEDCKQDEETLNCMMELMKRYGYINNVKEFCNKLYSLTSLPLEGLLMKKELDNLVSIIILTFNGLEHTKKCLESIKEHSDWLHEIIVVDNGSTDGTIDYLASWVETNNNVRVIANKVNKGFAAGNNQGMSIARGNYIVLLNNDTVVTRRWLQNMMDGFTRTDNVGIVGPMSNYVTPPQQLHVKYNTMEEMQEFAIDVRKNNRHQYIELNKVIGFCVMIKKEVIDGIGGLDTVFGLGNYEDDDLCIRAKISGYKILMLKDVFIHHTGSQSFKDNKIDYSQSMRKNWAIFRNKWRIESEVQTGDYKVPDEFLSKLSVENIYVPIPDINSSHHNKWWHEKINVNNQFQKHEDFGVANRMCEQAAILCIKEKYTEALNYASNAYRMHDSSRDIVWIYAKVLDKLGMQDKVIEILKEYLKKNSDFIMKSVIERVALNGN